MSCKAHPEIIAALNEMKTDIAIIKACLTGDNGLEVKVNKHDRYLYMAIGVLTFLSFAVANIGLHIK